MIVLDTNVVSEPLRPEPDRNVLRWLDRQAPDTLYLTTITLAELWTGIALLPSGRRQTRLRDTVKEQILPLFSGRVLDFDALAAAAFGPLFARAQAHGNSMDFADCSIAAIAATREFAVATRNTKDFAGSGLALINPWNPDA